MKGRRGETEESGRRIKGRDERWDGGRGAERWRRVEGVGRRRGKRGRLIRRKEKEETGDVGESRRRL